MIGADLQLCGRTDESERRMLNMQARLLRWAGALGMLASVALLGACNPMGARQIPVDRFDYNTAIAQSTNEQMLLNLVRLRYSEVPVFLAVNSVLTQYVWNGDVSVSGAGGESLGFPAWSAGGGATLRYIERPTVTYSPLSGQEFAAQLISPVRADVVFSLVSSGWPPDQLFIMTLQRINDVENLGFDATLEGFPEREREFNVAVELIIELVKADAIELTRVSTGGREDAYFDFAESADELTLAKIREFKELVGLAQDRSHFRVTRRIVGRSPDEITLRMHSLVELMGQLSAGVQAPPEETGAARATESPIDHNRQSVPLKVNCHVERPIDAFVAVEYEGNWYSVQRSDHESKRAFGLLIYLFQMQASQEQGAAPLLTIPIG